MAVAGAGVVVDVGEVGLDIAAAVEAAHHLGWAATRGEANGHTGEAGKLGGGPRGKVEEAGGDASAAAARKRPGKRRATTSMKADL